jgi:hypothetical protein
MADYALRASSTRPPSVRCRLLGAELLEPLHDLGALNVELVESLQQAVANRLEVLGGEECGARGLTGFGGLRGRGESHQRRLQLRDLAAQITPHRNLARGCARRHEGSPTVLAAHGALGLEARVDGPCCVHVHAGCLRQLADAREPVARAELAALNGGPDTARELRTERDVAIPINAQVQSVAHFAHGTVPAQQ